MYALPALLTPLQYITFTTEKTSNCINEELKGTNKGPINLPSCFSFMQLHQLMHLNVLIIILRF